MFQTVSELRDSPYLLLNAISGSRAYGTAVPSSDTDYRGVFILPQLQLYGLQQLEQLSDDKQDEVYYELGRFVQLLNDSNPNILELLAMPEDCILYQHPILEKLSLKNFLSKRCLMSFGGYAMAQIKKAHGLNKKVMNPMAKERKTPLDFCYVLQDQGSVPLKKWLEKQGIKAENCGLVNVPNAKGIYALFVDKAGAQNYRGIISGQAGNALRLSSIPKAEQPVAWLSYNQDGYSSYCTTYKDYWDWVAKRNEARYENTIEHGKNYDAKNMMHTFRLLDMAKEIALRGTFEVRRSNADWLLRIRKGSFEYAELLALAEQKLAELEELFKQSALPKQPNKKENNRLLQELRRDFYAVQA